VLGHTVRLMPPAYVKPYVKRQKNDAADAEAICEAVTSRADVRLVEGAWSPLILGNGAREGKLEPAPKIPFGALFRGRSSRPMLRSARSSLPSDRCRAGQTCAVSEVRLFGWEYRTIQ
jgi:hypothetical protein